MDRDDEFTFARDRSVADFREQLAQACAPALLVQFRQFAPEKCRAVGPEYIHHVRERRGNSVYRLEEEQRTVVCRACLQPFAARRGFRGRESFEAETVGWQSRYRQSSCDCGGTRNRRDRNAAGVGRLHEPVARIAHQRRAGITDERHRFAVAQLLDEVLRHARLVVFVERYLPLFQP